MQNMGLQWIRLDSKEGEAFPKSNFTYYREIPQAD